MKNTINLIFISLLLSFMFVGCKKYDEGGLIGKAEKRLTANKWKLDEYLRNGNDETSLLLISNFTETFSEGGNLTRSYTQEDGDQKSDTGVWSF